MISSSASLDPDTEGAADPDGTGELLLVGDGLEGTEELDPELIDNVR